MSYAAHFIINPYNDNDVKNLSERRNYVSIVDLWIPLSRANGWDDVIKSVFFNKMWSENKYFVMTRVTFVLKVTFVYVLYLGLSCVTLQYQCNVNLSVHMSWRHVEEWRYTSTHS